MKRKNRVLCLEQLEDRCVPSLTVTFSGGNLSVSGTSMTNITLNNTGANSTFTVLDGAANLGTYAVTGNINITSGNNGHPVNVNLLASGFVPGNLTIRAGNGNYAVTVAGAGAGPTLSAVRGMTNIATGPGNDTVAVNTAALLGFANFSGGNSPHTINIGTTGVVNAGGDLLATRFSTINLGTGAATTVGGNLYLLNSQNGGLTETATLGATSTVNGNVVYVGDFGSDRVSLAGTHNNTAGASTQIVTINNAAAGSVTTASTAVFNGTVTYYGGSGGDSVTLNAATFNGDLNLILGNGTDTWSVGGAFTVAGNMNISAGNGDNPFGTFAGTVNGNLTFNLGNGTDSIIMVNPPAGTLSWTSGNGNDSVTLGSAASAANGIWNVNLQFGNGDDSLTLSAAAPGNPTISGRADGGGRITMNTYTQGANWVPVNFTLTNFP